MKLTTHRVSTGPPQFELFPCQPPGEEATARSETRFVDPDPHALYAGGQPLADYLVTAGLPEVIAVRQLVRSVDLSGFFSAYQAVGRAPYHPGLMLGLVVYSTAVGLSSLREIERFARSDVRAWWLTGGAAPDHATIGRFLSRHADQISGAFFEDLAAKIVKSVGDDPADLALDGTTTASMARRYRLLVEESATEKAQQAREAAETHEGAKKRALLARGQKLEVAADYARQRTKARREVRLAGEAKVAESDPEAVYQKQKDGTYAPSYKPTIAATKQRIVVGVDIQPSSENKAVVPLLEQAKRIAGRPVECVRADAGFLSGSVIQAMLDQGVEEPLISNRAVASHARTNKPGQPKKKLFPVADFSYDGARDVYRCPAGKELRLKRKRVRKGTKLRIYGGAPCKECPRKTDCTRSKTGRTIERREDTDLLEAMSHYMSSPQAVASYKQRAAMVEPVFADLYQRQGFRRFRRSGLSAGVRLEFVVQIVAHNLNRYLDLTGQRGGAWGEFSLVLCALRALCELRSLLGRRDAQLTTKMQGAGKPLHRPVPRAA